MSDYLIHYGVKGMKWGVRKQRPTGGNRTPRTSPSSNATKRLDSSSRVSIRKERGRDVYSFSPKNGRHHLEEQYNKYGDDRLEVSLTNYACNQIKRLNIKGRDYAIKAIQSPSENSKSALRLYDHELSVSSENGYNIGHLYVFGDRRVFTAGVEADYSDEERWYSIGEFKKLYPDVYKRHYS